MTEGENGAVVPPICAHELFNNWNRSIRTFFHSSQFRLETDEIPNVWVGDTSIFKNLYGCLIIFRFVSKLGKVKRSQPCSRIIVARGGGEFDRRLEVRFCFRLLSL